MIAAAMGHEYARMPYPIIADPGAAESVLPTNWCLQSNQQDGATTGKTFPAANGSTTGNNGRNGVSMVTRQGQERNMRVQVCGVTTLLASVHTIVKASHSVTSSPSWDQRGSFIQHQWAGERRWPTT